MISILVFMFSIVAKKFLYICLVNRIVIQLFTQNLLFINFTNRCLFHPINNLLQYLFTVVLIQSVNIF